ncbi:MAG: alanine/glycine:cation symporter family protein [Bacteroidota bacterium]
MKVIIDTLEAFFIAFGNAAWGLPLLILLLGGGIFFSFYIQLIPFRYFRHAIDILRGKYDKEDEVGQINHYQALSTALAATVGMGNISGVAVAITTGGPGAVFWMWVSAFIGISTKFFTCTLAVMYRGKDSLGEYQGGPMYVITEGMGKSWKPLAVLFCVAGLFGVLPAFQANQLTQTIRDVVLQPMGMEGSDQTNLFTGIFLAALVSLVIFGGIKRIGEVAGRLVPSMVVLYSLSVIVILLLNYSSVLPSLRLIFEDAFTGNAVLGGAVGAIIMAGARRAAFSNEAGIGTAPLAHGAAKTNEPIREGLIAMLGPVIDTLIVCTMTALAIIVTDSWQNTADSGITVTLNAFEANLGLAGRYILTLCVAIFAVTTMFSMSYYGTKCFSFLAGAEYKDYYNYFYVATIILGAVISLPAVLGLIDGMYATMAIPTMISALWLSPKVKAATKAYFQKDYEKV